MRYKRLFHVEFILYFYWLISIVLYSAKSIFSFFVKAQWILFKPVIFLFYFLFFFQSQSMITTSRFQEHFTPFFEQYNKSEPIHDHRISTTSSSFHSLKSNENCTLKRQRRVKTRKPSDSNLTKDIHSEPSHRLFAWFLKYKK